MDSRSSWVEYHAKNMALPRSKRAWSNPNAKAVFREIQRRQRLASKMGRMLDEAMP